MKKALILILGGLFLASAWAYADHHEHKGHDKAPCCDSKSVDKRVEKLTKKLDLTKEQQAKVRTALEEKMAKKQKVHEEMQGKMETIHNEHVKAMDSILNDDQKKKHAEMMKSAKDKDHCEECCGKGECPHKKK